MKQYKTWAMFVREKHTGTVYGWVGRHGAKPYETSHLRSTLSDCEVVGISRYSKAKKSAAMLADICRQHYPGKYCVFLVRASKHKNSNGLTCKYIHEIQPNDNTKTTLVMYEFTYDT